MHEEFKISIKVPLQCCNLTQGTISPQKMVFKVSQGRKFVFQAQKWSKMAILAPLNVPLLVGKNFDSSNLFYKVTDIAPLGSGGEISIKNAIYKV